MEKKSKYRWSCPSCNYENVDTRRSFVFCVNCGKTQDSIEGLSLLQGMTTE